MHPTLNLASFLLSRISWFSFHVSPERKHLIFVSSCRDSTVWLYRNLSRFLLMGILFISHSCVCVCVCVCVTGVGGRYWLKWLYAYVSLSLPLQVVGGRKKQWEKAYGYGHACMPTLDSFLCLREIENGSSSLAIGP